MPEATYGRAVMFIVLLFVLCWGAQINHRVNQLECQLTAAEKTAEGWYGLEPC